MEWLSTLIDLPIRALRGYLGELDEIRAMRDAGLCILCGRSVDGGGDFCVEHHREQMTAP